MVVLLVKLFFVTVFSVGLASCALSPFHDIKEKSAVKSLDQKIPLHSPHKVLSQLDNEIMKSTKNVTQNSDMENNLYQIAKDLVSAILTKLDVQDKITRITREALETPGTEKGISAIETRRVLDYISRTLSRNILTITRVSTEPELHRLVYGLSQIASEVSIVSALNDNTYSSSLSRRHASDSNVRRKRANQPAPVYQTPAPNLYNIIMNSSTPVPHDVGVLVPNQNEELKNPYSVLSRNDVGSVRIVKNVATSNVKNKGHLNQTAFTFNKINELNNETNPIIMKTNVNNQQMPIQEESYDSISRNGDFEEDRLRYEFEGDKITEILETKAKKAILYAGDMAYLAASSVVAMRRSLTASIEVQMSVRLARNISNHQELMLNLARTAAQQAAKEAKSAASKAVACERVNKLALKYIVQSRGAKLNHVANRIAMDTLPLVTMAKSMAYVSSEIAINSLYQANEEKPSS